MEYYYLSASLPMLEFGMKPPFSYSDFLTRCEEQLSAQDIDTIKRAVILPSEDIEDALPVLREWKRFEFVFRNEMVRYRALKFSKDPLQYIRGENYPDPFIARLAHWVTSEGSPLEAELALDRIRWEKLEELSQGHYFDIDYLVSYALKLQILERWDRINSEGGMRILQELLEKEVS